MVTETETEIFAFHRWNASEKANESKWNKKVKLYMILNGDKSRGGKVKQASKIMNIVIECYSVRWAHRITWERLEINQEIPHIWLNVWHLFFFFWITLHIYVESIKIV